MTPMYRPDWGRLLRARGPGNTIMIPCDCEWLLPWVLPAVSEMVRADVLAFGNHVVIPVPHTMRGRGGVDEIEVTLHLRYDIYHVTQGGMTLVDKLAAEEAA